MDSFKTKDVLILCFRVISILVIAAACFILYRWWQENNENKKIKKDLLDNANIVSDEFVLTDNVNTSSNKINFDELKEKNSQTVGWIKVNNTDVDYPVVQHTNNEYYLTHNFENSYNSAGWIFMDYRNNSSILNQNTIIYGHNRRDTSMFGTLKNTLDESWCNEADNQYIVFSTLDKQYIAQIFSIYKINSYELDIPIDFESNEAYNEYVKSIISKSYYDFRLSISPDDKILTLCTCDDNSEYRILIHAKIGAGF